MAVLGALGQINLYFKKSLYDQLFNDMIFWQSGMKVVSLESNQIFCTTTNNKMADERTCEIGVRLTPPINFQETGYSNGSYKHKNVIKVILHGMWHKHDSLRHFSRGFNFQGICNWPVQLGITFLIKNIPTNYIANTAMKQIFFTYIRQI